MAFPLRTDWRTGEPLSKRGLVQTLIDLCTFANSMRNAILARGGSAGLSEGISLPETDAKCYAGYFYTIVNQTCTGTLTQYPLVTTVCTSDFFSLVGGAVTWQNDGAIYEINSHVTFDFPTLAANEEQTATMDLIDAASNQILLSQRWHGAALQESVVVEAPAHDADVDDPGAEAGSAVNHSGALTTAAERSLECSLCVNGDTIASVAGLCTVILRVSSPAGAGFPDAVQGSVSVKRLPNAVTGA